MKISPNYAYYNGATAFQNRLRINQIRRPKPIIPKNNPNYQVYIYEDLNLGIDINERTYDSFTGLRDKQYLLAVLTKKMEESQTTGKPLTFAMFDMDNFKSVNELLGYEVGDDFIKFIADAIDQTAQENGLSAYRFGGEEFVVIFENQDEDGQKEIVNKIVNSVNTNRYIKAQEETYSQNAQDRLVSYSLQISKINDLMDSKAKKEIYEDLRNNMQSEEAKNDPYLLDSIKKTDEKVRSDYLSLLQASIMGERDNNVKLFAINAMDAFRDDKPISKGEQDLLDEYLKFKFDKSAELFQVKKWLRDFKENKGFSITGSAVTFNPNFMKNKTPMQLIGIAGESLKRGKEAGKGKGYLN